MTWTQSLTSALPILCVLAGAATPAHSQEVDAAITSVTPHGFRPMWLGPATSASYPRLLTEVATDDAFASLGRGFNPVTNTILDIKCVNPVADTVIPLKGTLPYVKEDVVTDMQSHARVAGSSFSAGVIIKAVSLGFGSGNSQGDYFNQVESFVRLYARIPTEGTEWPDVVWTDDALKLVQSDMPEFIRQCGTRYVRAVVSGHLLDATVRFALLQDGHTETEAKAVSVGVEKLFGISAGKTEAESQLATHSSASLWSQGRGALALPPAVAAPEAGSGGGTGGVAAPTPGTPTPGQPAPTPPTPTTPPVSSAPIALGGVTQLINWYNTGFAAAVEKAKEGNKDASPLYIRIDDYRSKFRLAHRMEIPMMLEDIANVVAATGSDYATLVTILSTADFATAKGVNNSIFFDNKPDEIADNLKLAKGIFGAYKTALSQCSDLAAENRVTLPEQAEAVTLCRSKLTAALVDMSKLTITRKLTQPAPPKS